MHARTGEDFARLLRNALSGTDSTSKMRDSLCLHSQAKNGQSNLTFSSEGILALSSEYCCMSSCSLCALCSCCDFDHRRVYRSVTLASRVLGLGFLGKACLSPLIEKYSGGGGKPPGTLSIEITACSQAKVPDHQQHNCITSFGPADTYTCFACIKQAKSAKLTEACQLLFAACVFPHQAARCHA